MELKVHAHHPVKIGAFSAASKLTGVMSDVEELSVVLHQHGTLAFFDYATCDAYVKIGVNPARACTAKDAPFVSGHKFVGGPGTSGLLVVKTNLVSRNTAPTIPGGGTVLYVTLIDYCYGTSHTEREENGTPNILGDIRLELAFQVKERIGTEAIMNLEHSTQRKVYESLSSNEWIALLGRFDVERLPIFSFLIRFADRFLHFNFACALLIGLFGIQTRSGHQYAGPYGIHVMGVGFDGLPCSRWRSWPTRR